MKVCPLVDSASQNLTGALSYCFNKHPAFICKVLNYIKIF